MGLEDLAAIREACRKEAEELAREKAKLPALEAHTCTLTGGGKVTFDVPNTRK